MGSTKKERPKKRQLVRWSDDLDKQVLLAVQYGCNEAGVRIPWDDIANLMGEITGEYKFSGGAIVQHLSKLRSRMESHAIKVPPALKRGTITNAPSKVYATGNKRKGGPSSAKKPTSITAKAKKAKARTKKSEWEDEDDSDDVPARYDNDDDEDEDDDSDGEYGSAKKKRKVSTGKGRAKKQIIPAVEKGEDDEELEYVGAETPVTRAASGSRSIVKTDTDVHKSIESPSPSSRTRGFKHKYLKTGSASEDDGDEDDGKQPREEAEEEEDVKEEFKSDGEVSPHTNVETSVASAPGYVDLTQDSMQAYADNDFDFDFGSTYDFGQSYGQQTFLPAQQYQLPSLTGLDFSQPTGTSFSTNRTRSMASVTSGMPLPAAYGKPGPYASVVGNEMAADSISDDLMFGDQYFPPVDYSSPKFPNDFDTFS